MPCNGSLSSSFHRWTKKGQQLFLRREQQKSLIIVWLNYSIELSKTFSPIKDRIGFPFLGWFFFSPTPRKFCGDCIDTFVRTSWATFRSYSRPPIYATRLEIPMAHLLKDPLGMEKNAAESRSQLLRTLFAGNLTTPGIPWKRRSTYRFANYMIVFSQLIFLQRTPLHIPRENYDQQIVSSTYVLGLQPDQMICSFIWLSSSDWKDTTTAKKKHIRVGTK